MNDEKKIEKKIDVTSSSTLCGHSKTLACILKDIGNDIRKKNKLKEALKNGNFINTLEKVIKSQVVT
jgi:hypothetical protein